MPNATVDPNKFERVELKTLAEAFIEVRPLPYGMKLQRRDKATKMYMEANPGKRKQEAEGDVQRFELETMNEWATLFDFAYCIGDHNLEDVNGVKLDLGSPMTLKILNPKVGSEIESIISSLNDEESEEDIEDFIKRHTLPTVVEPNTSPDLEPVEV
jgi:hypothetical protein